MLQLLKILSFILILCVPVSAQLRLDGVDSKTELTEEQQRELKENLDTSIFKEHMPIRNDYVDEYDRGTVEYSDEKVINPFGREVHDRANYSFHKTIIPDGSTITEVNFTQKTPYTEAIQGKNLHFVRCNLKNVLLDPSWTFDGGLQIQERETVDTVNSKNYRVIEQILKGSDTWVEVLREEITR
jgi:hypothetical protein